MPEFSVIIPSFNHARFIADAVRSVLDQTWVDLELIVVDDGSEDDSLSVLSGFTDPRLKVLAQSNQGAHAAINHGLCTATGDYLAILNSDDRYHPQRLAKARTLLQNNRYAGLVGSYIEIIDQDWKQIGVKHGYADCSPWSLDLPERSFRSGEDLHKALLTENYWSTTSNFIFPRTWFESIGEFRPLRFAHDWDFALRMAKEAQLIMIPEVLMGYRVHAANTIRKDPTEMIFEICWILATHLPQHLITPKLVGTPTHQLVEELLNSIYTFGADRVLSVMLLQRLAENPLQSLNLLDPTNPTRANYLAFIQRQVTRNAAEPVKSGIGQWPKHAVRRLIDRIRKGRG